MAEQLITISLDAYIEALEARRAEVEPRGWVIPDVVWNYFIELLEEGCGVDVAHSSPSYIVDNIAVNGVYGEFENYMDEGETREDFIERANNEALAVFPEEDFVIWSL